MEEEDCQGQEATSPKVLHCDDVRGLDVVILGSGRRASTNHRSTTALRSLIHLERTDAAFFTGELLELHMAIVLQEKLVLLGLHFLLGLCLLRTGRVGLGEDKLRLGAAQGLARRVTV